MSIKTVRRALGLLIFDIVIIIGIFILQFRTDSSFIEKLGNLQITLAKADTEKGETVLKNQMQLSYNGLILSFDEQKPAQLYTGKQQNNSAEDLTLLNYSKSDGMTYEFDFTEDVKLFAGLSSLGDDAVLTLRSEVPSGATLYIPYNYAYSAKIHKNDGNRIVLNNKKSFWEIQAYGLSDGKMAFNHENEIAQYSVYEISQQFSFDSIVDLPIASASVYNQNVEALKTNLINSFKNVNVDASTSEQTVVSYIAAMAERGEYTNAVDSITQNYKRSGQRTYLSAPYLNTLQEMNASLDSAISENTNLINKSASSLTLDIFTVRNIANFMYIQQNSQNVETILKNAAAYDYKNASLVQAVGVLQVYNDLVNLNKDFAELLKPAVAPCVERITAACALNGSVLTISDNDTFLSVVQAVETGAAIMRCGISTQNPTLEKAGYALINSYISESGSFDLRTLSNMYPVLAYSNWYYPHIAKIENSENKKMWAWTCAKAVSYTKVASDEITYTVDFPDTYTHYVILKGVPHFRTIYIYDMAFRTDPRFETYNSSGYVYRKDSETLLLKSRHKSEKETIRLELGEVPAASPKKEAAPAKPADNTQPAAQAESEVESSNSVETPAAAAAPEAAE